MTMSCNNNNNNNNDNGDTIVDIAAASDAFGTLVEALEAADLVDVLAGEGPFTVFAPTDPAFDDLPEGTLEALLEDTEQLAQVLQYHVVQGRYTAEQLVQMDELETLSGQRLTFGLSEDGFLLVNNARVTLPNIEAANGIIHVIDTVLIPA
jgi:uncharacterized surface protein with fasciclin (FAS1) repeats